MKGRRQFELADRKQQLMIRSAELRLSLSAQSRVLHAPFAILDQVKAAILWLGKHPLWPIATLTFIAVSRPRRALLWVPRIWWGWRMYRQAQQWISREPRN